MKENNIAEAYIILDNKKWSKDKEIVGLLKKRLKIKVQQGT